MTNRELQGILAALPPDLPVYVDGYEYGVVDLQPGFVYQAEIVRDYHGTARNYGGPHQELRDWDDRVDLNDQPLVITQGLLLARGTA